MSGNFCIALTPVGAQLRIFTILLWTNTWLCFMEISPDINIKRVFKNSADKYPSKYKGCIVLLTSRHLYTKVDIIGDNTMCDTVQIVVGKEANKTCCLDFHLYWMHCWWIVLIGFLLDIKLCWLFCKYKWFYTEIIVGVLKSPVCCFFGYSNQVVWHLLRACIAGSSLQIVGERQVQSWWMK